MTRVSTEPFFRSDASTAGGDGRRFIATESTRGPWSNDHQHAGPPTALLARALERMTATQPDLSGRRVARVTYEMLRPIPIGPLVIDADIEKQGKKTTLARLRLLVESAGGPVAIDARALLVRSIAGMPPIVAHDPPPPPVSSCPPYAFTFFRSEVGYHTSIELRRVSGAWGTGAFACWMRQRVPLVDDEVPTGVQRTLVLADAGSGVSAAMDPLRYNFANADLDVHVEREPEGEWIVLDGKTSTSGNGTALASTVLRDARGTFGHGLQTLIVEPRA